MFRRKNVDYFLRHTPSALILTLIAYKIFFSMTQPLTDRLLKMVHLMRVLAGLLLLVAFSWEILSGHHLQLSRGYLTTQLFVCLLFLADGLLNWALAQDKLAFLGHNWLYLLLSVPWLNLVAWSGVVLPSALATAVGLLPILLIVLAVYILFDWLDRQRIHQLFYTYLVGLLLFTYLSALVVYDFEGGNDPLNNFGDALWWAGMSLSTAGSSLTPNTLVGKVLSVMLPMAGMLFLPIFTTYIIERYTKKRGDKR